MTTLAHEKLHGSLKSFMLNCALNGLFQDDYEKERQLYRTNLFLMEDGKDCYTNFSNIFIGLRSPEFAGRTLDEQYRSAQAIIGHEVAHLRFTDKPTWDQFVNSSQQKYKRFSRYATDVLNILEDRRIEYYMGMANSFLKKQFFLLGTRSVKAIAEEASTANFKDMDAQQKLLFIQNALLYMSHMKMWPAIDDQEVLGLMKKCYPFVLFASKGVHTKNAAAAAAKIMGFLEPWMEDCKEPPAPTYSLKGETGTSKPVRPEVLSEMRGGPASDEIREGDITENLENAEPETTLEEREEEASKYEKQLETPHSITDQIIRDYLKEDGKTEASYPEKAEDLKIKSLEGTIGKGLHAGCRPRFKSRSQMDRFSAFDYEKIVKEMEPSIQSVVSSIQEIAELRTEQYLYEQSSGVIDRRKLARFTLLDEMNIFRQTHIEEENLKLEVMLLVDASGSNTMKVRNTKNGTVIPRYVANQMVAILLHESLKRLSFKHSIWTFQSVKGQSFSNIVDYSTCFRRDIGQYLKEIGASGSNRDGYAIRYAGKYFNEQANEPKRLLIVLSDGQPSCTGYGGETAMKDVRQAVKDVTESGCKVAGIFTGDPSENRYFHNEDNKEAGMYENALFVNNDSIFDLPDLLQELLAKEFEEHLNGLLV